MASFVLVHGAWHGGWCWKKVVRELEAAGHRVEAPDLPGHGDDPTAPEHVDLMAYTDRICKLLDAQTEAVVLVGHSMGGLVISQVAEQRPEALRCLVYLAAILPKDGEGFGDIRGSSAVAEAIEASEDGHAIRLREDAVREIFYADCSDEDVAFAIANLCPQPAGIRATEVSLSRERFGSVARDYIECLQDRAILPEEQKKLHTQRPCRRVYTLDSSHSPFFSMPEELARLLEQSALHPS